MKDKKIEISSYNRIGFAGLHNFREDRLEGWGGARSHFNITTTNKTDSGLILGMKTTGRYSVTAAPLDTGLDGVQNPADPKGLSISAPEITLAYGNYKLALLNCAGAITKHSIIMHQTFDDILWMGSDHMCRPHAASGNNSVMDSPSGWSGSIWQYYPENRYKNGRGYGKIRIDMKLGPIDFSISDGQKNYVDVEMVAKMNYRGGKLELAYDANDADDKSSVNNVIYISYEKTIGKNTYCASFGGNRYVNGYSIRAELKEFLNKSNNSLHLFLTKKLFGQYSVQGVRYNYEVSDDVIANAGVQFTDGRFETGGGIYGRIIKKSFDY